LFADLKRIVPSGANNDGNPSSTQRRQTGAIAKTVSPAIMNQLIESMTR
jgi:hypothetical protein